MNTVPIALSQRPDHSVVQALANELWVKRGRPLGDDWNDWFNAELQIREQINRSKTTPQKSHRPSGRGR